MARSTWWETQLRRHPIRILLALLAIASTVEVLQYRTEGFPGAHAGGEITRNLAYALIGAQAFHLLVVELPARRRRQVTYEFSLQALQVLVTVPVGYLRRYQDAANLFGIDLDVYDQASLSALAEAAVANGHGPAFFSKDRATMMKHFVEVISPHALSQLAPSISYFDPEVSHALSLFPRTEGLTNALQVRPTPTGSLQPDHDVWITWELLEAARRLYQALVATAAYDEDFFQARLGEPPNDVELSAEALLPPS